MKRLLLFLLLACPAFATTVTGTIVDPNNNPYANGTASAYSLTASGQPGTSTTPVATTGVGSFTMTLAPATYIFTICAPPVLLGPLANPAPKQTCFSSGPIAISGGSQDVSAALAPLAVLLGPGVGSTPSYLVAGLPSAVGKPGQTVVVTDAATQGNCTVGGGSSLAYCRSNGTIWQPLGDGGGGNIPVTTKGDLFTFSTVNARQPVGSDGLLLTADSTQATGIKWAANSALTGNSTFPAAVTSLNAYGDSITAEYGMPTGQGWAAITARVLGLPITNNFAVSGARLYQTGFYPSALTQSPSNAVGSMTLGNSNDLFDVPTSTAAIVAGDMAMSVYLGLPPSQVKQVINSAITLSGTWSTSSAFGQTNNVAFSSTGGNTATGTVTGTTVYIGAYVASGYGTGTVTVDGASQGSVSFVGAVAGGAVFPVCFRYSGFSAGSHTVVLTVTSGFNSIQWMAGNGTVGPYVFFGNTIPRSGFTTQPGVLNSAFATMIGQLQGDGLNVKLVDMNSVMLSTPTVVSSQADLIHPNSYGHSLLAGKFLDTFSAGATTLGQLLANNASHIQALPFGINGGSSLGWSTNPVFAFTCFSLNFTGGAANPCTVNLGSADNGIVLLSNTSSNDHSAWLLGGGVSAIVGGNGGSALNTGIASTTLTTITDGTTPWTFTFPNTTAQSNLSRIYSFDCQITYQASAITTSLVLGVVSSVSTGTATLLNNAHIASTTNGATFTEASQNSTPTGFTSITTLTGAVAATANANLNARIWGTIEETTAGGTLSIQAAASPSGTVLIMRGSRCNVNIQK